MGSPTPHSPVCNESNSCRHLNTAGRLFFVFNLPLCGSLSSVISSSAITEACISKMCIMHCCIDQASFFNTYAVEGANRIAGKLSFVILNLSFEIFEDEIFIFLDKF